MYKYLYEKHYKDDLTITRLLFNTSQELFEFLLLEEEKVFNAGGYSAEIRLHRIDLKE
ncbi:MAG: hypothetical protein IJ272_08095 [Clostridia bacterium]|nr:hypothetical protein [Clostridia bacterium]